MTLLTIKFLIRTRVVPCYLRILFSFFFITLHDARRGVHNKTNRRRCFVIPYVVHRLEVWRSSHMNYVTMFRKVLSEKKLIFKVYIDRDDYS